jgi:hypothetical protein
MDNIYAPLVTQLGLTHSSRLPPGSTLLMSVYKRERLRRLPKLKIPLFQSQGNVTIDSGAKLAETACNDGQWGKREA